MKPEDLVLEAFTDSGSVCVAALLRTSVAAAALLSQGYSQAMHLVCGQNEMRYPLQLQAESRIKKALSRDR